MDSVFEWSEFKDPTVVKLDYLNKTKDESLKKVNVANIYNILVLNFFNIFVQ